MKHCMLYFHALLTFPSRETKLSSVLLNHVVSLLQRCGGQAAQLCHQEVCESSAHQERQENHCLRPQRRLPQLHRGKLLRCKYDWITASLKSLQQNKCQALCGGASMIEVWTDVWFCTTDALFMLFGYRLFHCNHPTVHKVSLERTHIITSAGMLTVFVTLFSLSASHPAGERWGSGGRIWT